MPYKLDTEGDLPSDEVFCPGTGTGSASIRS